MNALADPVRLQILASLQMGDISPSAFAERTGVDLSYASRSFRRLTNLGFAQVAEERRAHRGGASIERVYRKAQRPAFTAAAVDLSPPTAKAASHPILGRLLGFATEALNRGTLTSESDSVLVYDTKALEEDARLELVRLLDELERELPALELETGERLLRDESEAMLVTVGLTAFEVPRPPFLSSQSSELLVKPEQAQASEEQNLLALPAISPEMTKGLSNRWRSRILMELAVRPISPSRFVDEVGGDLSYIARCFRDLNAWGLVEVAEERKGGRRGGGVERVYKNVRYPRFSDAAWRILPHSLLEDLAAAVLAVYMARAGEAIEAGTLDAPGGRHLTCHRLVVDRMAWRSICSRLGAIFELLPKFESESISRNGGTVEGLVQVLIGLMSFRLPGGVR